MSGIGLTASQRDVLLVIQELTELDGKPPTYTVARVVDMLVDRGRVLRAKAKTRGLIVVHPVPMPDEPEIELAPEAVQYLAAGSRA